jgi:ADP-ribose pyrophosphatase YjhB (NUDIX family)
VQAKNGPFRETEIWEVPSGLLSQGEDLSAGAVRKVKEETGIETDFVKVIGFRHTHKVVYEKSDLLFLCILHPLTSTIAKQELEHANVQWIPLSQFSAQDYLQDQKMLKKMIDVCISTLEGGHNGFSPRNMQTGRKRGSRYFYYNTDDCKD